jgi:hypothetical protein
VDGARREAVPRHASDQTLHIARPDRRQWPVTKGRVRVDPQNVLDHSRGLRSLHPRRPPPFRKLAECDLAVPRINPLAGHESRGLFVEPTLGVDLPWEVGRMLVTGGIAVPGSP